MKLIDLLVPVAIGVGTYVVRSIAQKASYRTKRTQKEAFSNCNDNFDQQFKTIDENVEKSFDILKEQLKKEKPIQLKLSVAPGSYEEKKFLKILSNNPDIFEEIFVRLSEVFGTDKNTYVFKMTIENLAKFNDMIKEEYRE